MSRRRDHEHFTCGFIPLTDCATLAAAHEFGFAAEEGVALELVRETSWSNIRDKMAVGLFDVAHMLAPMPIAMSLGLSSFPARVAAPFVLSVNGNMIGVSSHIAKRLAAADRLLGLDAAAAAEALRSALDGAPLRIGAPWTFSMHTLLVEYWLSASGFDLEAQTSTSVVPPAFMTEALAAGELDLFCVGEPWGSMAVEHGAGSILLPATEIWAFAPEKVLGVREAELDARPDAVEALIRALYRAARWAAKSEHRGAVAEMLTRAGYVDAPTEVVERALRGAIFATPGGDGRHAPRMIELFDGAATFPWRSQAQWIAWALGRRRGVDGLSSAAAAAVWRPDIYRRALERVGAPMPTASSKLEGSLAEATEVGAVGGSLVLGPDRFFDGAIFEPRDGVR
ncbi:MAG: ABC transporter substrate-binding protein [Neomegalonema sp.]|nr:ABC transporter substrate-binding protein [Neomegalonema sp.]